MAAPARAAVAGAGAGAGAGAAGGAILVYFTGVDRKVYVLTGKEGRYLKEKYPADVGIEALQTSDMRTKEEAKSFFSGKAKEFERTYKIRVNFSQVTGEPGNFHTVYRYLPDKDATEFKYGIPKGRVEPGETGLDAAKREFQEEVGVRIDRPEEIVFVAKTRFDNYDIYRHEVPSRRIDDFNTLLIRTQATRRVLNYGELFDVQMRPLDIIIASFHLFNSKSKDALRVQFPSKFPAAGGKRKTRRTKQNRKNRSARRTRRA